MPYSQQTWSGQGMRGPSVAPMGGQIIASSLANMGQSIGAGIEKFQQAKGEAKGLRNKLRGFGDAYGMEEKDWNDHLDSLGLNELKGLGENLIIKQASELHKMKMAESKQAMEHAASREEREQTAAQQGETDRAYTASVMGGDAEAMSKVGAAPSVSAMKTVSDIESQKSQNVYRDAQVNDLIEKRKAKNAEMAAMGGMNPDQVKRAQAISDGLMKEPAVRKFYDAQSMLAGLEKNILLKRGKVGGPADIAMVFQFMKSLDPGSTVREGEYATAAQSGSIPQNIVNAYNKMVTGQFLEEMRPAFLEAARSAAAGFETVANNVRQRYVEDGSRYGIPEDYSGGKQFNLKYTVFNSADEAESALNSGAYQPGDFIHVLEDGEYVKYPVIDSGD